MPNRISTFWQRVSDGIEIQQLWGQFQADARASYKLHAGAGDWKQAEEESKWRRFWRVARGLFWAMSPGRRVLLLIALVLLEFPDISIHRGDFDFHMGSVAFPQTQER